MMQFLFVSFRPWFRPLLLALLLLVAWVQVLAQGIPPRPSPPRLVNDLAGMMRPDEAAALEQKLVAYNDSTSSQISVVTVPTLGDYEIADYAQKLYEAWGIGQKGTNYGVLLLIARQEQKARIQTGYGLEGAIPDALAKRIISNTIVPAFREEQYYQGLNRATDQLIALAKGEYQADQTTRPRQRGSDDSGSGWTFWLIIGALILFMLLRSKGGGGGRNNRGFGGGMIPPIIFGDFSGGRGVFGGGGGGFGGSGGGGGFSGFGGGSSGGGGASGDW